MSATFLTLTEEEFDAQFPLVTNHLNPSASWAFGEERGCLFETYGEELAFVRKQDPRLIWTLLDGDDGQLVVQRGYHVVNRIGYLISQQPVPDDVDIEVVIFTEPCDDWDEEDES